MHIHLICELIQRFCNFWEKRDQVSTNQQIEMKLDQGQSQQDLDPIVKIYIRVKNMACEPFSIYH